jgi:hypothetical protein
VSELRGISILEVIPQIAMQKMVEAGDLNSVWKAYLVSYASVVLLGVLCGLSYAYTTMAIPDAHGEMQRIHFGALLGVAGVFSVVVVVGGVIMSLIALPLFAELVRRRKYFVIHYLGAGVVLSLVAGAAIFVAHERGSFFVGRDFRFAVITIVLAGPISGLAFWFAVTRERASSATNNGIY